MKIRCPGCSKVLDVPDTAAGKVVKCPCGKQLRAPGAPASQTPASQASTSPAAPAQPRPAAQQPVARPAAAARPAVPQAIPAQPAAPQAIPAQPAVPMQPAMPNQLPTHPTYPGQPVAPAPQPDDMFSDLTEGDLSGVKPVNQPGASQLSGPRGLAGSSVYAEAGMTQGEADRRDFLSIAGNLVLAFGAMGAGGGLIFWDVTREKEADDGGGGFRLRRRSPITAGVALIIAGFGWMLKTFGIADFWGDDD